MKTLPSSVSKSLSPSVFVHLPVRAAFPVLAVLAVLYVLAFLFPSAAHAQIPRGNKLGKRWSQPYNNTLLRQYLTEGSFFHTITVDSGGSGDFISLSAALAFVTSQNPSFTSQWTLLVYPGTSYTETNLTIPPFTLIQGFTSPGTRSIQPLGRPMIQITGTTRAGVTLSLGSTLVDLGFNFTGVLTPGYKAIHIPAGAEDTTLTRVVIFISPSAPNVTLDILSITGGSLTLEDTSIQRGGNEMTATRHLFCSAGSAVLSGAWLLASSSQAAVVETAGGFVRILHSRIFGGATLDLKNTSGTLSADQVSYTTESGPITRAGILSPRITLGGSALPAACAPPEIYINTTATAPKICACIALNTWRCAPLS
jgi:hypothetical protein